jgi:hypothetical protein
VPSFLPHVLAPALVALAFFPIPRRTVLLLAPTVWLPDLDYLVQSQHRAVTHSIFVPLALLAAVIVLWRRRDPAARFWEYVTRPGAPVALSLIAFFVASHELMDVFAGGVVLLWPFTYTNFFADLELVLHTQTNTFEPVGEAGTEPGVPEISDDYAWLSYVDTAILVFLLACLAGWLAVRVWRSARGTLPPRPVLLRREASPME